MGGYYVFLRGKKRESVGWTFGHLAVDPLVLYDIQFPELAVSLLIMSLSNN